jgi:hypothetical protein
MVNAGSAFADIVLKFNFTGEWSTINMTNSGWRGVIGFDGSGNAISDWNSTHLFTKETINGNDWYSIIITGTPNSTVTMQGQIYINGNYQTQNNSMTKTSEQCYTINSTNKATWALGDCPSITSPEPDPIVIKWKNTVSWPAMGIHVWKVVDGSDISLTGAYGNSGEQVTIVDADGWYSYTTTEPVINFLFYNYESQSSQTLNVTGVTASTCYEIIANGGGFYASPIDCDSGEHTYTATVPAGTKTCYLAIQNADGTWTAADTDFHQMTCIGESPLTFAITIDSKANYKYKYCASNSWDNVEVNASGVDISDRSYTTGTIDPVVRWKNNPFAGYIAVSPITVKFKKPTTSAWSDNKVNIHYWEINGLSNTAWSGVSANNEGNGWYSFTFPATAATVNFIFNHPTSATTADKQTSNIESVQRSTCYEFVSGDAGAVKIVDCPSAPATFVWTGAEDSNYNNVKNWNFPVTPVVPVIPDALSTVYIPGTDITTYPALSAPATLNECADIYFMQGAQVARTDLLTYDKAHVQLNLGLKQSTQTTGNNVTDHLGFSAGKSTPMTRDRWYMLSMPLKNIVTGDLTFGGFPFTYMRTYQSVASSNPDPSNANGAIRGTWSDYIQTNAQVVNPAEGLIFWVSDYYPSDYDTKESGSGIDAVISSDSRNYGLKELNGILELPYFDNPAMSTAHRTHKYEGGTSTFYRFNDKEEGCPLLPQTDAVSRGNEAYRFIFEDENNSYQPVEKTVTFDASGMALVGNPFLSAIDFDALHNRNTNFKPSYQLWTGSGFVTYTTDGEAGIVDASATTTDLQYIAPMQSFLIEKTSESSGSFTLPFNMAEISKTVPASVANLRSPANVLDKLDIVASNPYASVRTFIANREYGQTTLSDNDSRKIIMDITEVPEVYTLKDNGSGKVAVSANIINTNNQIIPLVLATSYAGEMSFTFSGMDNYNAAVKLIDNENGEFDLTGLNRYEYVFDQAPASSNRFFIQFVPATPTGFDFNKVSDSFLVYYRNNTIHAVTSPDNPIHQLYVYNLQGKLIYADRNVNASYYPVNKTSGLPEVCMLKIVTAKGVKNSKVLTK